MSTANYEKHRDTVLELVLSVAPLDMKRVSKSIFDIASTNKFYSEIYANLYRELVERHDPFRELLDEFVEGFTCMDSVPVYVDPDKDYDGFCLYSKACDIRKSTSTFLVNCAKQGIIPPEQIIHILCSFIKYIHENIRLEGKGKIVEEVVENVFIIATLCKSELKQTRLWESEIVDKIQSLVTEKNNKHPSFTSRSSFKCMDLVDNLWQ
jgi:hypothetical protein